MYKRLRRWETGLENDSETSNDGDVSTMINKQF